MSKPFAIYLMDFEHRPQQLILDSILQWLRRLVTQRPSGFGHVAVIHELSYGAWLGFINASLLCSFMYCVALMVWFISYCIYVETVSRIRAISAAITHVSSKQTESSFSLPKAEYLAKELNTSWRQTRLFLRLLMCHCNHPRQYLFVSVAHGIH